MSFVLILTNRLVVGGAERLIVAITRAFTRGDTGQVVIAVAEESDEVMVRWARSISLEFVSTASCADGATRLSVLLDLIRRHGIRNILLVNAMEYFSMVPGLKAAIHDLRITNLLTGSPEAPWFWRFEPIDKMLDCYLTCNAKAAFALREKGIQTNRIQFVPKGVDINGVFCREKYDRTISRSAFGMPEDAFTVGYIGRLSNAKDPFLFLKCVDILATDPIFRFVMVGAGVELAAVSMLVNEAWWAPRLLRLTEAGFDDVPRILAALDVLLVTSKVEGGPLIVREALSMGVPVVTTNVGEVEEFSRDGWNGFIAKTHDAAELANLVTKIRLQPRSMADNARLSMTREEWTESDMATTMVKTIYQSVDETRGPAIPPIDGATRQNS